MRIRVQGKGELKPTRTSGFSAFGFPVKKPDALAG